MKVLSLCSALLVGIAHAANSSVLEDLYVLTADSLSGKANTFPVKYTHLSWCRKVSSCLSCSKELT